MTAPRPAWGGPPPDIAFDRLLKRADMALYGAKSAGRDGIVMLM